MRQLYAFQKFAAETMERVLGNSPNRFSLPGLAHEYEDRKQRESLMLGRQQKRDSVTKGKYIILNFSMSMIFSKEQNVVGGREGCTLQ